MILFIFHICVYTLYMCMISFLSYIYIKEKDTHGTRGREIRLLLRVWPWGALGPNIFEDVTIVIVFDKIHILYSVCGYKLQIIHIYIYIYQKCKYTLTYGECDE